jgi:hypothetical protein
MKLEEKYTKNVRNFRHPRNGELGFVFVYVDKLTEVVQHPHKVLFYVN